MTTEMLSTNHMVRLHRTMTTVASRPITPGAPSSEELVSVEQTRSGEVFVCTTELGVARIKHHYDRPQARTGYSPGMGACYIIFTL